MKKLLPLDLICTLRRYQILYHIQASEVEDTAILKVRTPHSNLDCSIVSLGITEIGHIKSYNTLAKTDVFSSSEMEDVEAASRVLLEASSWMD